MGIETKKKKSMNVDELRAYRVAYGGKLGAKDFTHYVVLPGVLFGVFSFLLLYNGWVSAICVVIGMIYGVSSLLPKSVRKQYEQNAFSQRNKFLNNITQVLTDDKQTVLMAIGKVTARADGQFKDDLNHFHAMLIGADSERIREAVIWFSGEYDDDVIFMQYLEQLETTMIEGKTNIDTLKDIKTYHNDIRKKQEHYERVKGAHLKDMKQLIIVTIILIVALAVSFGFETYLRAFARHPSGYIASGLYLLILAVFFKQFVGYLFDDSVMEIRKK
ncbi:hypothetical protein HXA34_20650 [Salipaludibacillus agaradhaerens]|jgi:hypothetical protein|uniref:hypothetical protein n=1 Tax=Salipaludibacillus agaradhaerens TaxID=76935 RepID=UPI002150BC25|nr:hypothetical protein [Salipaludibacillus agaradhaerens]MCR6108710.1 hypothetical protein [Salipaludibacillus agaradhaerens]MCR6120733.1 hypothetical protein [Salipaludibacillus agaradhaerens]